MVVWQCQVRVVVAAAAAGAMFMLHQFVVVLLADSSLLCNTHIHLGPARQGSKLARLERARHGFVAAAAAAAAKRLDANSRPSNRLQLRVNELSYRTSSIANERARVVTRPLVQTYVGVLG